MASTASEASDGLNELYNELMHKRVDLLLEVLATGGALVPPEHYQRLIERLTAKAVMRRAGVPTYPMQRDTMDMPRMTAGANTISRHTPSVMIAPTYSLAARGRSLIPVTPSPPPTPRRKPATSGRLRWAQCGPTPKPSSE